MRANLNQLRAALESGAITEDDLRGAVLSGAIGGSRNALAAAGQPVPEPEMDFVRNETTGTTTYLPRPHERAVPRYRVVGVGSGGQYDLGDGEGALPPVDVSRGGIEIPGLGRGQYSRDGRYAIVDDGQGGKVKVVLGYDREGSMRATKEDLALQRARAELEQSQEQTGLLRDKRQMLAMAGSQATSDAPMGLVPQKALEQQYGRAPEGMRWAQNGQLEDIPGYKKPMTESQAKALGFGTRAAEASAIMDVVGEDGKVQPSLIKMAAEEVPLIGGALGRLAGATVASGPQLQVEQAQRNFVNAVLRRESGAVISPGEFANAVQQYFPQPNDPPKLVEQKRRNREMVISALREEVGNRGGMIDEAGRGGREFGAPAGAPRVGEIRKGYEYTGGPPGSPGSWRKVQAR